MRIYHYPPERKCDAGGRKCYVVVRRRHFVAHLYAPSAHLFHVGILGSPLGVCRNVAPVQKNVNPVCLQHIDVREDGVNIRQNDQDGRKHHLGRRKNEHHGQQLSFGVGKNESPGRGDQSEGHLDHFPGLVVCIPVQRRSVVARRTVKVVRQQHAGVRENSDGIFHRVFVHVHVDARTEHIDVVSGHS